MNYKQIQYMRKDLEKLDKILNDLNESLLKNPDDKTLKLEIMDFKSRYNQVNRELKYYEKVLNLLKFDVRLFKQDNSHVDFNLKDELFSKIQNIIYYTNNNDIVRGLDLGIDDIREGSLDLILAPLYEPEDIFKPQLLENLKNINKLIDSGDDKFKLKSVMDEFGVKALIEYKNLLGFLIECGLNLEFYSTVSHPDFNKRLITVNSAKSTYETIDSLLI